MEFKDYYQTLGVAKSATEKEIKQAFRSLPGSSIPTSTLATRPPRPSSRRSTRRTRCSAIRDKRRKYDELGANWRMYEQAQQQGQGFPGGSPYGFGGGRRMPGRSTWAGPARLPHHVARGDAGPLRQRGSVLGLLPHVLRRRRRASRGPGARRPGGPDAEGPGHRAGRRADARRGLSRRHAACVDQGRRPRANDRRAYSGGRQGGLARARRRRRRLRGNGRPRATCTCACR